MDGGQLAMSVQTQLLKAGVGGAWGGSAHRAPSESSPLVDSALSPPLFFSMLVSLSFIVSEVLLVCTADALIRL